MGVPAFEITTRSPADQGAYEAVVAGAAGHLGTEAAEGREHIDRIANITPPVDPAVARRRSANRVLLAAAVVTAGSAAAQLGAGGPAFSTASTAGLLWSAGALGGAVGTSLLAVPVLPRLGALAVTIYACGLAGLMLLAAAIAARTLGGQPILRTPTPAQLAALAYLTIAITAIVFIAWYGALERLGVDRTGLFNGLVPRHLTGRRRTDRYRRHYAA